MSYIHVLLLKKTNLDNCCYWTFGDMINVQPFFKIFLNNHFFPIKYIYFDNVYYPFVRIAYFLYFSIHVYSTYTGNSIFNNQFCQFAIVTSAILTKIAVCHIASELHLEFLVAFL